jgi:hypothetical protein
MSLLPHGRVIQGMTADSGEGPGSPSGHLAAPSPEPDVHILTVRQKHEDVVTLHASEADAMSSLAGYAREFWREITGTASARVSGVPDSPDGLDDDTVISTYFDHYEGESYGIVPASLPQQDARFTLDEAKAKAFLGRSLRRWDGSLAPGDGDGAGAGEEWGLRPGWDPRKVFADETRAVADLVHQAAYEAGALALPAGVDIDLLIDSLPGGDWTYQWQVSFPAGTEFALCSPYSQDYDDIGGYEEEGDPKAKGSRAALGILREAEAAGNRILDAHARGRGRVPPARPRQAATRTALPGASPRPRLAR